MDLEMNPMMCRLLPLPNEDLKSVLNRVESELKDEVEEEESVHVQEEGEKQMLKQVRRLDCVQYVDLGFEL